MSRHIFYDTGSYWQLSGGRYWTEFVSDSRQNRRTAFFICRSKQCVSHKKQTALCIAAIYCPCADISVGSVKIIESPLHKAVYHSTGLAQIHLTAIHRQAHTAKAKPFFYFRKDCHKNTSNAASFQCLLPAVPNKDQLPIYRNFQRLPL